MILRANLALVLICAAAFTGMAHAQQYRWVDAKGVTQFGDVPPPGARNIQKIAIAAGKPEPAPLPFELSRLQKDFPVTLYTSPGCKDGCERARALLNKRGVPFKEVLVWQEEANEELKRISGGTEVPTMVVGRAVEKGFEPTAFDAALDSAGYPKAGALPPRAQKAPETPEGFIPPEGSAAKPVTQAGKAEAPRKAGPYDPSGLTGPAPKPGQYDPSGLTGPPPKPGQYGVPGEAK
jgi:glutaredoxin